MKYATYWATGCAVALIALAGRPFWMVAVALAALAGGLHVAQPTMLRERTGGLTLVLLVVALVSVAPRLARLL